MSSIERYADLAAEVMRRPARLGAVRLVAVDGPAGSGKTTFSSRLAGALRVAGAGVEEIHTDDLLEGWTDQVSFWPRLEEWVLAPLRRGEPGRYRAYDWINRRFGADWHRVPVPDVLVVEGVTSARAAIRAELTLGVFVTAGRALRMDRGIERDGEAARAAAASLRADHQAEWERWMVGEDRHFAMDDTAARVDLVVDGAPAVPHDRAREYLRLDVAH